MPHSEQRKDSTRSVLYFSAMVNFDWTAVVRANENSQFDLTNEMALLFSILSQVDLFDAIQHIQYCILNVVSLESLCPVNVTDVDFDVAV